MRGTFVVNDPDSVNVTLSITMPIKQWKELDAQLADHKWPSCDLSRLIGALTRQVDARLSANTEER